MFGKRRKNRTNAVGCGFVLLTGFLLCALLIINAIIVKAFLSANLANADQRIIQAAQFAVPVMMIVFEFWFYDLVTNRQR